MYMLSLYVSGKLCINVYNHKMCCKCFWSGKHVCMYFCVYVCTKHTMLCIYFFSGEWNLLILFISV